MTSLGDEPTDQFQEARKYPGGEFLELVLKQAYKRLGDQPIDNLYRACLLGGDTGARLMLAYDRRCLELWQKGDLRKAVRLLEVWASTCALTFLQRQEDQDAVLLDTARGFAMLFRSDVKNLKTELLAYREAMKAEQARRGEPGLKGFASEILYLRTLRALGDKGVPNFELLPMPWGTLREVLEAKPDLQLDITIFTDFTNYCHFALDMLISSLDVAKRALDQLGA